MHENKGPHQCPVCERSFERRDHYKRHLNSHQNERPFRCFSCHKSYNRRDLLTRHYATHEKDQNSAVNSRRHPRAHKACGPCAASKVKCDNARPCKRCVQASRPCVDKDNDPFPFTRSESGSTTDVNARNHPSIVDQANPAVLPRDEDISSQIGGLPHSIDDAGIDVLNCDPSLWGYPAFLDPIMSEDSSAHPSGNFEFPTDLAWYLQDADTSPCPMNPLDFTFDPDTDIFNIPPALQDTPKTIETRTSVVEALAQGGADKPGSRPWLWVPGSNQRPSTDETLIDIDENTAEEVATSPSLQNLRIRVNEKLDLATRDTLLQFISRTTKSDVTVLSFPDPGFLDLLIQTGLSKRSSRDGLVHPGTISYKNMRPELTTALMLAGCICVGFEAIKKSVLVLLEVLRLSLDRLYEADNRIVRDLQFLQAYMLWVDIGITCGNSRHMEIAESHFYTLCTALRRIGAFDSSMYHLIQPEEDDEGEALDTKWRQWATQESFKRLAYSTLEHDMHIAMISNRNPTTSYAEFTAPLPESADLWFAPSAETWKHRTMVLGQGNDRKEISLLDLLNRPSLHKTFPHDLDVPKARSVFLHGIAGQVFENRKQIVLYHNRSVGLQLAIRAQQQELIETLNQLIQGDAKDSPESIMMIEMLHMSLYVDIDDIQRCAGKDGIAAARKAYQVLEEWFQDVRSRNAVWHAGQVLRATRLVPPRQLRGYESIMIYHATLVLWIYGVLSSANLKQGNERSREQSALPTIHPNHRVSTTDLNYSTAITLDGPETQDTIRFLELGHGCAGLQSPLSSYPDSTEENQSFCDLRQSDMIMRIGSSILGKHFIDTSGKEKGLPPLVSRLCSLMWDLGTLPKVAIQ